MPAARPDGFASDTINGIDSLHTAWRYSRDDLEFDHGSRIALEKF
jgi:hypothetical protein